MTRLKSSVKYVLGNLAVGAVILVFFHAVRHNNWVEDYINHTFDHLIGHEAEKAVEDESSQLLFMDIDRETYDAWGELLITPRDKIARILMVKQTKGPRKEDPYLRWHQSHGDEIHEVQTWTGFGKIADHAPF